MTTLRLKSPPTEIATGFKSGGRVVKTPARLGAEKAFQPKAAHSGAERDNHPLAVDAGVDISADLALAHRGPIKRNGFTQLAATLIELMGTLPAEPAKSLDLRTTLAIAQLFPEQPPRRIIAALNAFAKDETKSQAARDKARFISNAVRQTSAWIPSYKVRCSPPGVDRDCGRDAMKPSPSTNPEETERRFTPSRHVWSPQPTALSEQNAAQVDQAPPKTGHGRASIST